LTDRKGQNYFLNFFYNIVGFFNGNIRNNKSAFIHMKGTSMSIE